MSKREASSETSRASKRRRETTIFRRDDYVSFGKAREGRVLSDDGDRLVVLSREFCGFHPCVLTGDARDACALAEWRDSVTVGAIVMLHLEASILLPAKVRAVYAYTEGCSLESQPTLVLEPVFLGATIRMPLHSLALSAMPPEQDPEIKAMLDSGFAFEEGNAHSSRWPPRAPYKSLSTPSSQTPEHVVARLRSVSDNGFDRLAKSWTLRAPCDLPSSVCMLREISDGTLRFCRRERCRPVVPESFPGKVERMALGEYRLPIRAPPEDETAISDLNLFYNLVRHGDTPRAAFLLQFSAGDILDRTAMQDDQLEICIALCIAAQDEYSTRRAPAYHPIVASVWNHAHSSVPHFVDTDLASLAESVQSLRLRCERESEQELQMLQMLQMRVAIWTLYKKYWGASRLLQLRSESFRPVEARVEGVREDASGTWWLRFKVFANYANESIHAGQDAVLHAMRHTSVILEAFSKNRDARFVRRVSMNADDWDSELVRVCGERRDMMAYQMLLRETHPGYSDAWLLGRMVCQDFDARRLSGTTWSEDVVWTPCEGMIARPETVPGRVGGIVVHPSAEEKIRTVAGMLLEEQNPSEDPIIRRMMSRVRTPADRGSTLLMCAPTVMYEWQRRLAALGVSSHVFHGAGRRGPACVEAMNRGELIVATHRALAGWDDLHFFRSADTPLHRLLVDEFDVSQHRNSSFVDGIMSNGIKRVWLLARECTKDVLTLSLPLLRVRPFFGRNGWSHDLVSDFRRRKYNACLSRPDLAASRETLHKICSSIVLCDRQTPSPPETVLFQHAPAGGFSPVHKRLLRAFGNKLFSANRGRPNHWVFQTQSTLLHHWRTLRLACWGVLPPVASVGERLGVGLYHTNGNRHLAAMQRALLRGVDAAVHLRTAVAVCKDLVCNQTLPEDKTCPVCLEALATQETSASPLSQTVVVGRCGHMMCGECADSMQRVAMENLHRNDYGPDVPINRPSCPICRSAWDASARPLVVCIDAGKDKSPLVSANGMAYRLPCHVSPKDIEENPLVGALRRAIAHIRCSCEYANVVVVCRSPELTQHLYHLHANCFMVDGSASARARARTLRDFNLPTAAKDGLLFITASLLRGLIFDKTRNFIVAERLAPAERANLSAVIHASIDTFRGDKSTAVVHAITTPVCPLTPRSHGAARVAPCSLVPPTVACVPVLPKTRVDYIRTVHRVFGLNFNDTDLAEAQRRVSRRQYRVTLADIFGDDSDDEVLSDIDVEVEVEDLFETATITPAALPQAVIPTVIPTVTRTTSI